MVALHIYIVVNINKLKNEKWCTPVLRITNGNFKMPCSGILDYAKSCSGFDLCTVLSPPHFFILVKRRAFSL